MFESTSSYNMYIMYYCNLILSKHFHLQYIYIYNNILINLINLVYFYSIL